MENHVPDAHDIFPSGSVLLASTNGFPRCVFNAASSRFRDVSPERTKSCPPRYGHYLSARMATLQPHFRRYDSENQLEKSSTLNMSSLFETARPCEWQFPAPPFFGANYPSSELSFVSTGNRRELKTAPFPAVTMVTPMADRSEESEVSFKKPEGLSAEEETQASTGDTAAQMPASTDAKERELVYASNELESEPHTAQPAQDNQAPDPMDATIPVNSTNKVESYWERRRRNNMSAKKSRDARKFREVQTQRRVAYLEDENFRIRAELRALQEENILLKRERPGTGRK
ncbi:hypothetical protein OS493_031933 [Desmophyllum pertusum]|uniref:BZIP domain-containing protein n=1 Tax=Desmophyllum pertusum TaxID=174260 RepID=A0A9W9ZX86_9CNID|nr:hypothetical protein OS493_031933 [Desmophyllum pertusum]